jgi:drug/metabolite transporter (DMT)-like permease
VFAADLALLAITVLWGASFVVTKDLLGELSPHLLLAARFAVAGVLLAALRPRALLRSSAAAWRVGLLLGLALYASFVLQTVGLAQTTPARSAFLTASYVFLVPLFARLLFGERVGAGVGLGALLATAGLALLTRPEVTAQVRRGDVLSALCAVGFAVHILALGRLAGRAPAGELALTQVVAAAACFFAASLALDGPDGAAAALGRLSARGWAGLAFLGAGCTALAYFVQTWAQRRTPAARAALIFTLEPAVAAAISVVLARERLGAGEALGGGLIVAGVVAAEVLRPNDSKHLK